MFSSVYGAYVYGIQAHIIRIEADVSDGLPLFGIVGHLDPAVKEARERVRVALKSLSVSLPAKRITVNLSPADLRKEGTSFDLAIAVSLLVSFGMLFFDRPEKCMFIGELGLDGSIRPVKGVLAMILEARKRGITHFYVPSANEKEGGFLEDIKVYGVSSLLEVLQILRGENTKEPVHIELENFRKSEERADRPDFFDICGMETPKRAAEIAVSGRHNLLLIGPAGSGKTMLARRMPGILPEPDVEECLELTKIYSACGLLPKGQSVVTRRPFRAPHHSATAVTLTGGGRVPMPGEITLASGGILFLDELPEFSRQSLEALREPLEDRRVLVARLGYSYEYPADCLFVAAMNPCRCGFYPDNRKCRCTTQEIRQYLEKISEPLLDRLDLCVETGMPEFHLYEGGAETSEQIRARVEQTTQIQKQRYRKEKFSYNAELDERAIKKYCKIGKTEQEYLESFFEREDCSARRLSRIIKVARTIADMDGKEKIEEKHITEAVRFRSISRKYWGVEA